MKWIRLWVDEVVKGTTFDELNLAERGLWWSLLLLAGQSLNPGIVEIRKGVKFTEETLASVVNCDPKSMRKYLKKLILVGKIDRLKDGRLKIVKWEKYQTRYEKYYKNNDKDAKNNGIRNGIRMHDREEVEEEVDKNKDMQVSPALLFPLKDGTDYPLELAKISQYEKTYGSKIDVMFELKECLQWNIDRPKQRKTKTGILGHINFWLNRAVKDKGPGIQAGIEGDGSAVEEARKDRKNYDPDKTKANIERINKMGSTATREVP